MKTLRLIGMALMAVLLSVSFASCSNDDIVSDESADGDETVDLSGLIETNLQVDGKTFWLEDKYNSFVLLDSGESASVFFRGKTEELEGVDIYAEYVPVKEYFNQNKTIGEFTYIKVAERDYSVDWVVHNWVYYDFLNGRVSIREDSGVLTLNFNNALFKNNSTGKCRNLNGYISYRI